MSATYLQDLMTRLSGGLARLPEAARAPHVRFLGGLQNPDGGFPGREGGSDLYYTAFALRGLAVLGALTPEIATRAADFLKQSLTQQTSVVDFFSLLYACALVQLGGGPDVLAESPADWPRRVADLLESFRTGDGGYAKSAGAQSGSTYHTFLVALSYQLLGREVPDPARAAEFVLARRREDGGFVEIGAMRRSGTNPTAAAVGVLQMLRPDALGDVWEGVVDYLTEMMSEEEGGYRANGRVPAADLLSSFTACWTLHRLGAADRIDAPAVRGYVEDLQQSTGGFLGGLWDERCDAEYTFYGLGTLALLPADNAPAGAATPGGPLR
jgi:geranylgeranyl transferase type-2 subunit beta